MENQKNKQPKQTICPVTKKCGSCAYQGVPNNEQLKKKKKFVKLHQKKFIMFL